MEESAKKAEELLNKQFQESLKKAREEKERAKTEIEQVLKQNFILEKDKKELMGTIRQRKLQMALKSNKDAVASG